MRWERRVSRLQQAVLGPLLPLACRARTPEPACACMIIPTHCLIVKDRVLVHAGRESRPAAGGRAPDAAPPGAAHCGAQCAAGGRRPAGIAWRGQPSC